MLALDGSAAGASAAGISVTPNTNDVVGLKSNDPTNTAYPNSFPLGARICNTSGATITDVTAALNWGTSTGTGATNIGTSGPTSVDLGTLNPGVCLDAYFQLVITRAAASFDATREYTVAATGSGATTGASPAHHRIYVEKLIAQNRNNTDKVAGPGGCNLDYTICDPAPTNLLVGNTYTFKLYGDTSTSQNTVEAFLDFPGTIFRVMSATSTASLVSAPAKQSVPGVYNDACVLQWDYTLPNYKGCTGTGGAGGNYAMTYTVKIISAGSGSLKAVIYDGVSGNWHLNSDYGNVAFTSNFVSRWPLDLTASGNGNVTSNPAGVNCGTGGALCEGAYSDGTTVTLTATPGSDESFLGWSGACSGSGATCVVSMNQAQNVTAQFTGVGNYPLSVSVTGLGSVASDDFGILGCQSTSGVCAHSYAPGASVTLTATPSSGQSFAGWTGGGCAGLTTTCTVSMNQARNVTAAFASTSAATYGLSIDVSGAGVVTSDPAAINCGFTCSSNFVTGDTVTLTATAEPGSVFGGWGGSCSGSESTCVLTMNQVRYATVTFSTPVGLTVSRDGIGSGNVSSSPTGIDCGSTCSADFAQGAVVTLAASPDPGSALANWGGAGTESCSGTTCDVTMSESRSVTATFGYAPSEPSPPQISGTAMDGQTLTASNGTWWLPNEFLTFTYQWLRCDLDYVYDCTEISGATESSLLLSPSEVNYKITVIVNASGGEYVDSQRSNPAGPVNALAPSNTVAPSIEGDPREGQTLTINNGTWVGTPEITFEYQWYLCDENGAACQPIDGAFGQSIVLTNAMLGRTLAIGVAGSNGGGITGVFGGPSAPIASSRPVISGTTTDGQTLATTLGTWPTGGELSYSAQWQRCDVYGGECFDIDGATGYELSLTPADVGHTIKVVIAAYNPEPIGAQTSDASAVVQAMSPVNTVLPTITSDPAEGQTVDVASNGTWSGTPEITYTYQWYACNDEICAALDGETGSSHTVSGDDVGWKLVLGVTGTNAGGSSTAFSLPSATVLPHAPTIEGGPEVSGNALEGATLSTTNGYWIGAEPITFTYQWKRCDVDGENCVDIDGATAQEYVLTSDDVGSTVTAFVTATNAGGSNFAKATPPIGPIAGLIVPVNSAAPEVTGTTTSGGTLSVSDGEWVSYETPEVTYQWKRCDVDGMNCADIDGATASTLELTDGDIGHTFRAVVTATNTTGPGTATSNLVGPVNGSPLATTQPATDVTSSAAQLNGTLDTRRTDSTFSFRWGTDPADLTEVSSGPASGGDLGPQAVPQQLTGLEPATTYYFRFSADSDVGGTLGDILSFTTSAAPAPRIEPPTPKPTPPIETVPTVFAVDISDSTKTMEHPSFDLAMPSAGSGTLTGSVKDDKRHVGAENSGRNGSGKTFTAFSQPFSAKSAGRFELPAKLSGRALAMLRARGFLRVTMRARFKPAGSSTTLKYKRVVKLRPFAIAEFGTNPANKSVFATLRTPRAGRLSVVFLLRDRATGNSTTVRAFSRNETAGGSFKFEAPLSATVRSAIASGDVRLMVKSTLKTRKYPARMLRSRIVACGFCG